MHGGLAIMRCQPMRGRIGPRTGKSEDSMNFQIPVEHMFSLRLEGLNEHRHEYAGPFGHRRLEKATGGTVSGSAMERQVLELRATDYGRARPRSGARCQGSLSFGARANTRPASSVTRSLRRWAAAILLWPRVAERSWGRRSVETT